MTVTNQSRNGDKPVSDRRRQPLITNVASPTDHRLARLIAEPHRKVATSAHAYVHGSTNRFDEWLEASERAALPAGPELSICGDCDVGNLGPVASTDGALAIQIRHFDQTVNGNPSNDLIRVGLSLAMAARGSDLPGVTTARMIERMIEGYGLPSRRQPNQTLASSCDMPKSIASAMKPAAGRSWKHLTDERVEGTEPTIPLGKRFWPLTGDERSAVEKLFEESDLPRLTLSFRSKTEEASLCVLDAAYWQKGCSSLGRLRVAVLVAIDKGKAERHCLMDIKEAVANNAPQTATGDMPSNDGQRVVTGPCNLSPGLGGRMIPATLLQKSVFIRELLPQDLKLEIEHFSRDEAVGVAELLARVVGRGHAHQLNADDRTHWLIELQKNRSRSLDAPSWLWNSVVDLVAAHEAAYLQHCRRYAMEVV